jgi:hypothetical protein
MIVQAFHIVNVNDLLVLSLRANVLAAYLGGTSILRQIFLLIEAYTQILCL